jgi:hypothetical protein
MESEPLNLVVIGIGGVGRRLAHRALGELPWVKTGFVESLPSSDSERDVDGPVVPFTIEVGDLNFAELQSDGFEPALSRISFFPMDRFSAPRHLAGLSESSAINLLRHRLSQLRPPLEFSSWFPGDNHPIIHLNRDWLTPALSRAVFLAFQDDLMRDLLQSQHSPVSRVKIVASPGGTLGAAWVGDVADFVSRRWPSSKIDVILADCSRFLLTTATGVPYLRYALRSLIAIEEICALVQSRNNLERSRFSLNLLSDLTTDSQGSCPGLEVLIPPLKKLLQYNESSTDDVTRVLLSSHLEKRVRELSQSTYPMETSREKLSKTWGLRTR